MNENEESLLKEGCVCVWFWIRPWRRRNSSTNRQLTGVIMWTFYWVDQVSILDTVQILATKYLSLYWYKLLQSATNSLPRFNNLFSWHLWWKYRHCSILIMDFMQNHCWFPPNAECLDVNNMSSFNWITWSNFAVRYQASQIQAYN